MDIDDLRTFLTISQTHSFSRSAELLYISQSAVTARIKALEQELGQELFLRNNKSVRLTTAGQRFSSYAKDACALIDQGIQLVQNSAQYDQFLAIGAPDSIWESSLFCTVTQFCQRMPRVCLSLHCLNSDLLLDELLTEKIDIGLCVERPFHSSITALPYSSSPFLLVKSPKLQLRESSLTRKNQQAFPIMEMAWGNRFMKWFREIYSPCVQQIATTHISIQLNLILNGQFCGFMPERNAMEYVNRGLLETIPYELSELAPEEIAYIVFLSKNSIQLKTYLEALFP